MTDYESAYARKNPLVEPAWFRDEPKRDPFKVRRSRKQGQVREAAEEAEPSSLAIQLTLLEQHLAGEDKTPDVVPQKISTGQLIPRGGKLQTWQEERVKKETTATSNATINNLRNARQEETT